MEYHCIRVITNDDSVRVPRFLGSTLRGAFGVALKNVTCINPKKDCENCFASSNCLYFDFYEEKNRTPKLRFDTELDQKEFKFGIYLFEEKCRELPYILSSIIQMSQNVGIGVNRELFEIKSIEVNGSLVYKEGEFSGKLPNPIIFNSDNHCPKIRLHLLTPLRIKQENKLSFNSVEAGAILQSIDNRVSDIMGFVKKRLDFTPTFNVVGQKLEFLDVARYSNRQQTKMQLGGLVGYMDIDGLDSRSYELLKFGEVVGVGKSTVFGLGKIKVEELW